MKESTMIQKMLMKIYRKLDEIEESLENFMGFFELDKDEIKELEKDIKSARNGKTLEEIEKEIGAK